MHRVQNSTENWGEDLPHNGNFSIIVDTGGGKGKEGCGTAWRKKKKPIQGDE